MSLTKICNALRPAQRPVLLLAGLSLFSCSKPKEQAEPHSQMPSNTASQVLNLATESLKEPEIKVTSSLYTVAKGDTLWKISQHFKIADAEKDKFYALVKDINGLRSNDIKIGQALLIPSTLDLAISTYVIQKDDSLSTIAKRYGTNLETIMGLNKIVDANKINRGQTIRVPNAIDPFIANPEREEAKLREARISNFISTLPSDFGKLSRKYESKNSSSAVSNSSSDPGGLSLGLYQISASTRPDFIKFLREYSQNQSVAESKRAAAAHAHAELSKSEGSNQKLIQTWKSLSKDADFSEFQKLYILKTHFEPVLVHADKLGFSLSPALAEVFKSLGVQHAGFRTILNNAAAGLKDIKKATVEEQISAIYAARENYVKQVSESAIQKIAKNPNLTSDDKKKQMKGKERLFSAVLVRLVKEKTDALNLSRDKDI